MFTRHDRARLTILSLVVAAAFALLSAFGSAQGLLQLGSMTYARAAAPALSMPVTSGVRFFTSVGGVAFSAVARGEQGLVVSGLRYDASAPDGQRLVVSLRGTDGATTVVRGRIYDWQLVPVARFANDDNGSAVTMFGHLSNKAEDERLGEAHEHVFNYHKALDNTLVGLRLLQADMLIIEPTAADLFREDGRLILGAGETGHDVEHNRDRFDQLADWQDTRKANGDKYQSYVVGDMHQQVTFAASNGRLAFTGAPYWNAWRLKKLTADEKARAALIRQRYNSKLPAFEAARRRVLDATAGTAQREAALDQFYALDDELEALEKQLDALTIEEMPEYSRALSLRIGQLDGVNPIVYSTVRNVMHYRALFKHYQQQDPAGFGAFLTSLRTVTVRPPVQTPTNASGSVAQP